MKKIILTLLLTLAVLTAHAAKSSGAWHSFPQPDGTQITVSLLGDEYFSWYQTPDGVLLIRQTDAFYIAQTDSLGQLESTGILAHNAGMRTQQEQQAVASQDKDAYLTRSQESRMAQTMRRSAVRFPLSKSCPHTGTVRVPVILIDYPDMPLILRDRAVWEEYFNGTVCTPLSKATRYQGYSSIRQYFLDASFGQLNFEFDFYGPYTAPLPHDSYGKKTSPARKICLDAIAQSDTDIDFSQYDSDDNGEVDLVYVLYAGTAADMSGDYNDVWPTCTRLNDSFVTADGKKINIVSCSNELAARGHQTLGDLRAGIGVACHEMSHGLGLPDLYWTLTTPPTDADGYIDYNNCGPENWDLMDGGETILNAMWPCQYTAWERDVMGWIDVEPLTEPTSVTLFPLDKEGGKAYRVTNPADEDEYYIIENYQSDAWNQYSSTAYGTGLMITHVNAAYFTGALTANNTYGKPGITILPADGYILALYSQGETINYRGKIMTMPSSYEVDEKGNQVSVFLKQYYNKELCGDPFAGTRSTEPVTSLAAYKNYTGEEMVTRFPITDIRRNSDGSMSFNFMGGAPITGITGLTATAPSTSVIYSLDGIRLTTSSDAHPRGLYICNGKKVVNQ